jgi:hypothetical protein
MNRDYSRNADEVAAAIIYEVVGHLMPSPVVNSRADRDAAEAFADKVAAKLNKRTATMLVRSTVEMIELLTKPDKAARCPGVVKPRSDWPPLGPRWTGRPASSSAPRPRVASSIGRCPKFMASARRRWR